MMKKLFAANQHYIMLALKKKNITFPTTKRNILTLAGNEPVRVDWDQYMPLSTYCKNVKLEHFTNKAAFFNAILGANTKFSF